MAFKDFFFKKQEQTTSIEVNPNMSTFSTPFGKIGEGNLSLPYVRSYSGTEPWIRFGQDNLYPQLINQMYYTSPLNAGIIDFKTNATIGGGYELISSDNSAKAKVDEYTFLKFNDFDDLTEELTKDLIMHNRIHIKMCRLANGKIKYYRISPDKVRYNNDRKRFTISEDWARSINIHELPAYTPDFKGECIYSFIQNTPGQDIYPIPGYCSSLNWAFLQGQMAYLQKSNIINSIFPSFYMTMTGKMTAEKQQQIKNTIEKYSGAEPAGKLMAFIMENPDELPTITALPTNNNDKLFVETTANLQNDICQAHQIDPLIMGIRVSGKLGSGNELVQQYSIFEKNVVIPLRKRMERILNELLYIGGVQSNLKIKDFQIVNGEIVNNSNNRY